MLSRATARGETLSGARRCLALISAEDAAHAYELRAELSEAFAHWALFTEKDVAVLDVLRPVGTNNAGAILVTSIKLHEEPLLRALLTEANKLNDAPAQLVILGEQGVGGALAQAS